MDEPTATTYACLGVATSGPDPERDAVLGVAVVRVAGLETATPHVTRRVSCAVRSTVDRAPGAPPPADDTQPSPAQAAAEVARAVGAAPVVALGVDDALRFVRRHGTLRGTPGLELAELAGIALPTVPPNDITILASALDIDLDTTPPGARTSVQLTDGPSSRPQASEAERRSGRTAAADEGPPSPAEAAAARTAERHAQLLIALLARLRALDPSALDGATRVARRSRLPWADVLQHAAEGARSSGADASEAPATPATLRPAPKPVSIDDGALAALLGPDGPLAERLSSYEDRPGQREMLAQVAAAFNREDQLLVEAGTGTGKSLAYLLPAAAWALENGRPVVIATHTTTLQDQLLEKDLPLTCAALDAELRAVVLKGRANYLCRTRLAAMSARDDLGSAGARFAAKLLVWAAGTTTGDRAELSLDGDEARLWRQVSAEGDACTPERCPYAARGRCWVHRARARAEAAHIIIVNHALLVSDVVVDNRLLPHYRHLVVDEAHHLEEVATRALGFQAGEARVRDALDAVDDVLTRVGRAVERAPLPDEGRARFRTAVGTLREARVGATTATGTLFGVLAAFVEAREARGELRLTDAARAEPSWVDADAAWDSLRAALEPLRADGERLLSALVAAEDALAEQDEVLAPDLGAALRELAELTTGLEAVISRPSPQDITWLSTGRAGPTSLHAAPLHVGQQLARGLFDPLLTLVLTSATLRTAGGFDFIRGRLSLPDAPGVAIRSPFDYEQSVLLCLPTDMPPPHHAQYGAALARTISGLAVATRGRTLALFTSYRDLRAAYHATRGPLGERGIAVLAQGIDGSRGALLDALRGASRPTVLLGTRSFWEGVDVPGEALSCLVIARLPFDVPTDPVFEARAETFDQPFIEYALPKAVLRFRQGFGRLIRSAADRGIVAVLDSRVRTKRYGRQFLAALPECRQHVDRLDTLPAAARRFVDGAPAGSPPVLASALDDAVGSDA